MSHADMTDNEAVVMSEGGGVGKLCVVESGIALLSDIGIMKLHFLFITSEILVTH